MHAALGIDLGCFIWGAVVAFGLGALLEVSELAYTLLKWCGAGYLCWLGIQLLLRPRQQFNTHPAESDSTSNWFLRGMLGNVLNPKMGVFYVSFLPQFIPAGHSPISWTFLTVTIHVLIGTLWSLTLITATRYAAGILKKTGRSEMDGPNDRLPVSVVCREAGHESAVVTQGRMPCFCLKNEQPVEYYSVVKRSGSNVRLASFFCKTMTIIGVPDAVIAHTANSVSIFCSAMRWSGNKKQTGKMRQLSSDTSWMSVMKRIPLVACYQETESSPPTMTPDDCKLRREIT